MARLDEYKARSRRTRDALAAEAAAAEPVKAKFPEEVLARRPDWTPPAKKKAKAEVPD